MLVRNVLTFCAGTQGSMHLLPRLILDTGDCDGITVLGQRCSCLVKLFGWDILA